MTHQAIGSLPVVLIKNFFSFQRATNYAKAGSGTSAGAAMRILSPAAILIRMRGKTCN
jgi:hypothetical protein